MMAEPAITFLGLACAIGTDATHIRTIDGSLRQLHRDAVTADFCTVVSVAILTGGVSLVAG